MAKVIIGVLIVAAVGGYFFMRSNTADDMSAKPTATNTPKTEAVAMQGTAKEFTMTAYYDDKGKWYSLKEMKVKKGDKVKVHITNTAGMHDFTIDELGIKQELPLNQQVTVEFTADKAGSFVYYCSKPGHRAGGQWGTLTVE